MFDDLIIPFVLLLLLASSLRTVTQGTVAVVTMFGKYRRVMLPGLNAKIPLLESIQRRISIQNRSADLEFQAITG
ncbi:MAG: SPFH domain-containing protein, partial [Candidatus Kapaibacterium sp.]